MGPPEKHKGAQAAVSGVVDAPEHLDAVAHREVGNDRRGHGHMGQGGKKGGQSGGDGRAADAVKNNSVAGPDNQVRPDAVVHPLLAGKLTHHDGDDGEHHDDFNGHREHADEGAEGAVQQVGNDELIHS